MKNLFFIIVLISVSVYGHAQSVAQINKQLDSLNNVKKSVQAKIKDMQLQLQTIKQKMDALEEKKASLTASNPSNNDFIVAQVMSGGSILRDAPASTGKTILTIPANETIHVFRNQQNLYFKVSYKDQIGYVSYSTIAQNQEIDDFLSGKEPVKKPITTTTIRTIDDKDPRYQKLVKLYGQDNAVKIMNGELWQGMSYGMVLESIGKPNSKTSANSPEGVKEQWIYNDYSLDFKNGELKNWTKK